MNRGHERDTELRAAVRDVYSAIAETPASDHPIPVGRELALGIGYPGELLDRLPAVAVEAFAGVSDVSLFAQLPQGAIVMDLGCGAGLDALIAAGRMEATGRVIAVDFSEPMLARARQGAAECGADQVRLCLAESERLPLRDASVDVALVNGIFNLNPGRQAIFQELARVVRPGGAVYAAELILKEALPEAELRDPTNWFAWIAGAKEGGALLKEFEAAGFSRVELLDASRNARTVNPAVLAARIRAQK